PSISDIATALCAGARLYLIPPESSRLGTELKELLQQHLITHIDIVPAALNTISGEKLPALQCVIVGGDVCTGELVKNWSKGRKFFNTYGPTECTVIATAVEYSDSREQKPTIGQPISNTQIYILDDRLQPVPVGATGELYIGGVGVARGYLNRPETTAKCFLADPFSREKDARMYKTGDLACYLPNGEIDFQGRADCQVKIRGNRIEPGEIEAALIQHQNVKEATVVAHGQEDNKFLAAYITKQETGPEDNKLISELHSRLRQQLPSYMIPGSFTVLDRLPLTPNGKVDRRALPEPNQNIRRESEENFVAPRDALEQQLAAIWSEVLAVSPIGIHDNFIELGGHSLLAVKITALLHNRLQVDLALHQLLEHPTIAALAERVRNIRTGKEADAGPVLQPVARDQNIPLAFSQEALWHFSLSRPEDPAYNEIDSIHFNDNIDPAVLKAGLTELVRRHESLRTTYQVVDGQPCQIINPVFTPDLLFVDLRQHSETEREAEAMRIAFEELRKPFDLTQGPVFRITLIQFAETDWRLYFASHHIALDAESTLILMSELEILYAALSEGSQPLLEELPVQYADFAIWQRQCLQKEIIADQLVYWEAQLKNIDSLQLPYDRPRTSQTRFDGAFIRYQHPKDLTERLKIFGQQEGVTLFTILAAAIKVLLHRYSGQEDIVLTTFSSHRNRPELEGLIGFFLNNLMLRSDLSGNPGFRELLQRVWKVCLSAYANQDVPFQKVAEHLNLSPIQVAFTIDPPLIDDGRLGWKKFYFEIDPKISKFDLTFYIFEEQSGDTTFLLEYNTDIFDAATIERMKDHLITLLEGIAADPEQSIAELPMLSAAERHQLLVEYNNTRVDYPREKSIHQLFEEQVEKKPDAVAVMFEGHELTYRELNHRSNRLAHYLLNEGVRTGTLIGICLEPSAEILVSILAVLKVGAVYVPMDPNYPQERLSFLVEDSKAQKILTLEGTAEKISSSGVSLIRLDKHQDAIAKQSVENLNISLESDSPAYVIYTSGSTGKPKGVIGTVCGVLNRLHWMWDMLPFGSDEICCQKTSINFVDHVAEIFVPLLQGVPLVIVPEDVRSDVFGLTSLMSIQKVSRIVLVPSLLKAILEHAHQEPSQFQHLRYVFCSGEALPLSLVRLFHRKINSARLFNIYGSSEVAADVTCFEVNIWETRKKILQYFKPELVHSATTPHESESRRKPFTTPGIKAEKLAQKFRRSQLPPQPITVDEYYEKLSREVLPYTIDTSSSTFIGHMTSALPDFLHDMSRMISKLNQNLVKIETSKSLIFLEREAIAILHRLFYGFSEKFYQENIQRKNHNLGIITTGGTTANITALLCARNQGLLKKENSWELSRSSLYQVMKKSGYQDIVIIGSRLMHYSFNKAASILGLGTDNIIYIGNNDSGTLDLNLLEEQIAECKKNKLYILAIIGIAGTTETGQIDPLPEMAAIAKKAGVYFHADAAWGGVTIFSEKHKDKLTGVEQADSITLCGHKQLYLPQGLSICLFRDPQMLNLAATTARYQAQKDTFDTGRFTVEGSRSALSLCLHGALHIIGKRGYEFLIDDSMERTKFFSELIDMLEPFELILKPVLNIVNYRYVPQDLREKARRKTLSTEENERINQLNDRIQQDQFEQGWTFVSKTTLTGTAYGPETRLVVFRTVLSNPNTTLEDLYRVLEDHLIIAGQIEPGNKEEFTTFKVHAEEFLKRKAGKSVEKKLKKNTVPIGKPIANTDIYILDKYGNLLPSGAVGELYVGGDGLAEGYLNQPELTREKFIRNPFAKNGEKKVRSKRLFKTGDLARWLPDGNIEFRGRIDHQVKLRGFRIELGEIEAALINHETVDEAVVLVQEREDNQFLAAYITKVEGEDHVRATVLRSWLRQQLPDYMIPASYTVLDSLPLMPNGKVDRRALLALDQAHAEEDEYTAPRTPFEHQLTRIWAKFLKVKSVGVHDNFFDLGGNSLLAMGMLAEIGKEFGRQPPVPVLLKAPTVEKLAEVLREKGWSLPRTSLVPIQPSGSKPPLFYVPPAGCTALTGVPYTRYLGTDQPMYGLQPLGFEDGETPHNQLKEMAAYYIKEICRIQPEGPYYLSGECFGTRVAFEMACQLQEQGSRIALLALFDPGPPCHNSVALRDMDISSTVRYYLRRTACHVKDAGLYTLKGIDHFKHGQFIPALKNFLNERREDQTQFRIPHVMNAHVEAFMNYMPQIYKGKITLFRSSEYDERDKTGFWIRQWSEFAGGGFECHVLQGRHWEIFQEPRFRKLVEQLKVCLEKAQAEADLRA
ncbi:MAG: aminotransferase class V-fold PLP-dependent enzyme, partial [Candidatus Electrothrix sp. EH2]|nr:aminotransferase class V-fold PLP-dependent enzyme [Candidatus Electrothrix sp. EH2]